MRNEGLGIAHELSVTVAALVVTTASCEPERRRELATGVVVTVRGDGLAQAMRWEGRLTVPARRRSST